jgi:hypothetical protein
MLDSRVPRSIVIVIALSVSACDFQTREQQEAVEHDHEQARLNQIARAQDEASARSATATKAAAAAAAKKAAIFRIKDSAIRNACLLESNIKEQRESAAAEKTNGLPDQHREKTIAPQDAALERARLEYRRAHGRELDCSAAATGM